MIMTRIYRCSLPVKFLTDPKPAPVCSFKSHSDELLDHNAVLLGA